MKTNPNDPAYPVTYGNGMAEKFTIGLTKREYFAAMAMQGLLHKCEHNKPMELHAIQACKFSDSLIAELNKESKGVPQDGPHCGGQW
jgi:hypothetical protein